MAKKEEAPKPAPTSTSQQLLAALNDPAALQAMFGDGTTRVRPTIGADEEVFSSEYQQRQLEGERLPAGFQPWRSGDEALPGTWDRNDKARLQAMMNAAGLYGDKPYAAGKWRKEDADALREILEFANYEGIDDINTAVRRYAEDSAAAGITASNRAGRAPLVVSAANPEAVRQVVRSTSLNLLGRRLSDAEEARLISGFTAQDSGAQAAQHGQGEAGGTFTEALSPEAYMTSQLQGTAQAGDQRYLDGFEKILQSATSTMVEGPDLTGKGGVAQ